MRQFTRPFRVRHYELDSFGHVNNAVYVNYMQEAAIEASTDAGFSPEWYREHRTGWVIRNISIRYLHPASYKDELQVSTWISEVKRVTSTREYSIVRVGDQKLVARARVNWVYLDLETGQPLRIPTEIAEAFAPTGVKEELGIRITRPEVTEGAYRYRTRRRVQRHEIDVAQHVNHTAYLRWVEQAYFDALRTAGHPIEETRRQGWFALQGGHEIEYLEPAFDNDEIEIVSWICEMGKVRGAWTHEIRCVNRDLLLAREYSLGIFVNGDGRPVPAPMHVVKDALRGPSNLEDLE
jgi:acyl-CoA thioester hydrolase